METTIAEMLTLIKHFNDTMPVVRTTPSGVEIRSRSGLAIYEDGHCWFHGYHFISIEHLMQFIAAGPNENCPKP